jgi:tRNA-dihydrouridine synthase
MKDLPLSAVMIHGRPYENPFGAEIDYAMIKRCVDFERQNNPTTVVLGNGGIKTPEEAKLMINKTGCDGVGLARGLYGKPWLFKQCHEYLQTSKYKDLSNKQIAKVIIEHAKSAFKDKNTHGLIELRKHLLWYVSGWPNAKELRSKLVKVESLKQLKDILK